jgi:predicted DNA-binding transcriptional regulator AlpA
MEQHTIDLTQPGRLRIAHLLKLFAISRTTLHDRVASGVIPKPDGHDGRMPYWLTSTIRPFMEPKS